MQHVVLAGGLGTRLRGVIPEGLPKPMASVAGRPFLEHLLDDVVRQGSTSILLLVGYAADAIVGYVGDAYRGVPVAYSREDAPLGTAGALRHAAALLEDRFVFMNGDTFAAVDHAALAAHLDAATLAMALADVADTSRSGRVVVDGRHVTEFREKQGGSPGLINAGVYACRGEILDLIPEGVAASFEVDVLERHLPVLRPEYEVTDGLFIDIGVPEDLARAGALFDR